MSDTLLRGAMEAQDERERAAGEKCGVDYNLSGCDWPDSVAEEVLSLRSKLQAAEQRIAELVGSASKANKLIEEYQWRRPPYINASPEATALLEKAMALLSVPAAQKEKP